MTDFTPCVQVAIPLPVQDPFTYVWANGHASAAKAGSRVVVPFRNREIQGYIVGFGQTHETERLKPIKELIDHDPVLDVCMLELTRWISQYYFSSWGEAIENALPKMIKAGKGPETFSRGKIPAGVTSASASSGEERAAFEIRLTQEQEEALARIEASLDKAGSEVILLHGVTGSGKTEIYIRAIETVLARGKSAICMVPEIALTTQIREFFAGHFPGMLEIIHSRLTDKERMQAWLRIRAGQSRVVLGPRSAIFAPVARLGLILMDEEHETSYKQAETPRYHAREVARRRAELEGAVLVLGSATPSLETALEAEEGKMLKLVLSKRVVERDLPEVRIVDLKREMENRRRLPLFSYPLEREVSEALRRKEAVLLLLNRRGFATQVQCLVCGGIVQCRYCRISLTYHQSRKKLLCHHCNHEAPMTDRCPACGASGLKYVGWGTEKIESEIARLFPQARVARLDTDVARKKGMQEKVLGDFRAAKVDILVGTQMIAKGFDFPRVTLVGVVSADVGLALPDFRSSERTFQLMTQVAGRAGRGDSKGRVIIQTFSPLHHSILFAKNHDYDAFYRQEIQTRRELKLPPFTHLVNVILQGPNEQEIYRSAGEFKALLKEKLGPSAELVGPAPLPLYRLRGHFRWHVMIKADHVLEVNERLREAMTGFKKPSRVKLLVDVDPVSVL